MKKLILGLLAAFLMTTGLVAISGTSATAACPYTSCVATKSSGKATVAGTGKATIKVTVAGVGTNQKPTGKVTVTISKKGTSKVLYKAVKSLSAGKATIKSSKLKDGKYTFKIKYAPASTSVFKASNGNGNFTVK